MSPTQDDDNADVADDDDDETHNLGDDSYE